MMCLFYVPFIMSCFWRNW